MSANRLVNLKIRHGQATFRNTQLKVLVADGFFGRLIGLLSRKSLPDTEGLLLVPCASIHTFGMRFSIDVIFLDRENKVLGHADEVIPNRIRNAPRGTHKVLELAQGNRIRTGINLDDYLIFD